MWGQKHRGLGGKAPWQGSSNQGRFGKKTGKTGSSLQRNFVIWREKVKKFIRETLPHWREIYPAGGKFCTPCREIQIFSRPASNYPILRLTMCQTLHEYLGAPSILVTNFLVKSPTKSPIFLFQVTKMCCMIQL